MLLLQTQRQAGVDTSSFRTLPPVEAFWPVTVSGWLALVLAISAVWGVYKNWRRAGVAPVLKKMEELKQHFDEQITLLRKEHDRDLNLFRDSVTKDLNGYSMREAVRQNELNELRGLVTNLARDMAGSIEDRRHINEALSSILRGQEDSRRSQVLFERQVLAMIVDNKQ